MPGACIGKGGDTAPNRLVHSILSFVFIAGVALGGEEKVSVESNKIIRVLRSGLPNEPLRLTEARDKTAESPTDELFQESRRATLATSLAEIGSGDRIEVFLWNDILARDPDVGTRVVAAQALARMQPVKNWPKERETVIGVLKNTYLKDPNPFVRDAAKKTLIQLHAPGGAFQDNPEIPRALFPVDYQVDATTTQHRIAALFDLGMEKTEVASTVMEHLNGLSKFLGNKNLSTELRDAGRELFQSVLRAIREGVKNVKENREATAVARFAQWDPRLQEIATHSDPILEMAVSATRFRLATDALDAVLDNEGPFPNHPRVTVNKLEKQMRGVLKAITGEIAKASDATTKVEGIRLLGEFASQHPDAIEGLNDILKKHKNKSHANVRTQAMVELLKAGETGTLDEAIRRLNEKTQGGEEIQSALREGAENSILMRNKLVEAATVNQATRQLVFEILSHPKVLGRLVENDSLTLGFILKWAERTVAASPEKVREVLSLISQNALKKTKYKKAHNALLTLANSGCAVVFLKAKGT